MNRLKIIVAAIVCTTTAAHAWEEPPRGSDLRAELLNTARVFAAFALSPPVEFVVSDLRQDNGRAFGILRPQRPGGGEIPWESTRYARNGDSQDWFDGTTMHVFFVEADGHWYVEDYSIGATDAWLTAAPICDAYRAVIPEFCS